MKQTEDVLRRAKQSYNDAKIRRGLFEFLWQFHPDAKGENPRPCPELQDSQIYAELQRILGITDVVTNFELPRLFRDAIGKR